MILAMVGVALAGEVVPELYGGFGGGYQGGDVVAGGLGGDVGLRLHVGQLLSVHGDVAFRIYLEPAAEIDLGVVVAPRVGNWRPGLGVELATVVGGRVTRYTGGSTGLYYGPLLAVRGIARPLAFDLENGWTISGPGVSLGAGLDGGLALGVEVLQAGWRFR